MFIMFLRNHMQHQIFCSKFAAKVSESKQYLDFNGNLRAYFTIFNNLGLNFHVTARTVNNNSVRARAKSIRNKKTVTNYPFEVGKG
jgi:hypothetical protein